MAEGIKEYAKRIAPYAKLELIDLKRRSKGPSMAKIRGQGISIALDPLGRQITSEDLGKLVRDYDKTTFYLGAPEGLPEELSKSCDITLSLSKLTLTSEMAKLLLMEQVYRALMILHSHPYHK